MAEDDVPVPDAFAGQGEPGSEGQMVDEHVVGAHPVHDGGDLLGDL